MNGQLLAAERDHRRTRVSNTPVRKGEENKRRWKHDACCNLRARRTQEGSRAAVSTTTRTQKVPKDLTLGEGQ